MLNWIRYVSSCVSWSSTNWIAFPNAESTTSVARDIFIVRPDGTGLVNLTNTPDLEEYWPSWNRTGDRLAVYHYNSDRTTTVVVYDVETIDGVPTIVDPKRRSFFAYSGVTVFKPNAKELGDALGEFIHPDDPAWSQWNAWLARESSQFEDADEESW